MIDILCAMNKGHIVSKPNLPSWPHYSPEEMTAVQRVMASNKVNYWTGQEGREFEREFAKFSDSKYAIAVGNGTLALDLALQGLRIGAHNGGLAYDEVIVTPRSFIASVSCVINAGAKPVFADVDIESGNISPATIKPIITNATKAIIAVHLGGWPCDMSAIMEIANTHEIKVIEDCAQAHGAKINGQSVGSFGHVSAWSFCQDKIMTTGGEGGMVTTNNHDLWDRMWSYKDHGKNWDAVYNRDHPPGFREWQARREKIAIAIHSILQKYEHIIRVPLPEEHYQHAYYRCYAYVKNENLPYDWTRDKIVNAITDLGAPAFQGTCSEIYKEKAFDGMNCRPLQSLEDTKKLGESSMMFLTHPNIDDNSLAHICTIIDSVLKKVK